jgi:hypothetical protein
MIVKKATDFEVNLVYQLRGLLDVFGWLSLDSMRKTFQDYVSRLGLLEYRSNAITRLAFG